MARAPWIGVAMGVALEACFLSPIPDLRTPEDRARALATKCRLVDERAALAAPEAVEADVVYVPGGPNGREARFRGARIYLAPSAGASHEAIERGLTCHQADVTLGRVPPRDDDPYVLPGGWLSIDVESSGDGFLVHVQADRVDDARIVLDRAKAFAASGRQSVDASPPPSSPASAAPAPASGAGGQNVPLQ